MRAISLQQDEFELIAGYIYNHCGIMLDETKVPLVESRLGDLVTRNNCDSYLQLYQKAQMNTPLAESLVDAITTNETSFFRDSKVFESLLMHLFEGYLDKSNRINMWSAACSFGQEPYTIAMVLKELINDLLRVQIQITCTDISTEALTYASKGIYTDFEMNRGLSMLRQNRHFQKNGDGRYKINDDVRSLVHFRPFNLLKPKPLPHLYDIVLCRNVAIYFDTATKQQIFDHIANQMVDGGCLIIGSSEMLIGISTRFERRDWNGIIYYQKVA
ncbi:MAG: protein-glutamate O-methyltransferase CheR [Pseudomonadales bacterium]|nr:protein-glutamate O-methyltransferase CheR [Pseudomonadales bacterium]